MEFGIEQVCASAPLREFSEAELGALHAEPQHLAMVLRMIGEDVKARALGLIAPYPAEPAFEQERAA